MIIILHGYIPLSTDYTQPVCTFYIITIPQSILLYARRLQTLLTDGHISYYTTVRGPDIWRNVVVSWYVTFYQTNNFYNIIFSLLTKCLLGPDEMASWAVVCRPLLYAHVAVKILTGSKVSDYGFANLTQSITSKLCDHWNQIIIISSLVKVAYRWCAFLVGATAQYFSDIQILQKQVWNLYVFMNNFSVPWCHAGGVMYRCCSLAAVLLLRCGTNFFQDM